VSQALQAQAANACWNEIKDHVFVGGKSGMIGSNSGAHLASVFFSKVSNRQTLDVSKLAAQVDANIGIVQSGSGVRRISASCQDLSR
jgi:hypothetical protein